MSRFVEGVQTVNDADTRFGVRLSKIMVNQWVGGKRPTLARCGTVSDPDTAAGMSWDILKISYISDI